MNTPCNNSSTNSQKEEFLFTEDYTNPPFFDWNKAENENGLVFSSIVENGFERFIKEKFINEMIQMRKYYIMRDYTNFRFMIHKSKSFKLFECDFIFVQSKEIERNIGLGRTFELENLYCNLVVRFEILFDKICEFAKKIKNSVDPNLIRNFKDGVEAVDSFESFSSHAKICYFRNQYAEGSFDFENLNDKIKRSDKETYPFKFCKCNIF